MAKRAANLMKLQTGRRKEAAARVRLVPGDGKATINGRPLEQYFPRPYDQMVIRQPLELTSTANTLDLIATVAGGGLSGQAGAVRHGVARALLQINAEFRIPLKRAGMLTRDARMVERKKYGLHKARKATQYSKR